MSTIELLNNYQNQEFALRNLIHYIGKEDHNLYGIIGARNLALEPLMQETEELVYRQIMQQRTLWQKQNNRMAFHIIISPSDKELIHLNEVTFMSMAYDWSAKCFPYCQVYFGLHHNTNRMHLHMLVSQVQIHNGLQYTIGKTGRNRLMWSWQELLCQYGITKELESPYAKKAEMQGMVS